MTTKITHGSWEGTPTALVRGAGGQMEGYAWSEAEKKWKPGFTEEAFTKSAELSDAGFKEAFPDVPAFTG